MHVLGLAIAGVVSLVIIGAAAVQVGQTSHVQGSIRSGPVEGIAATILLENFAEIVFSKLPGFSTIAGDRDIGTGSVWSGEFFHPQLGSGRIAPRENRGFASRQTV